MKPITMDEIDRIIEFLPGSYMVISAKPEQWKALRFSKNIPAYLGYAEEEYRALVEADVWSVVYEPDRIDLTELTTPEEVEHCLYGKLSRVKKKDGFYTWVTAKIKVLGMWDSGMVLLLLFEGERSGINIHQTLLDYSQTRTYVYDTKTMELLYANRPAVDERALPDPDYVGRTCYEYVRNRSTYCDNCVFLNMEMGESHSREQYNEAKDIMELDYAERLMWSGRDVIIHNIETIRESQKVLNQLRASQKNYELAIETAELGVWEYDIQKHRISSASRSFERFGITGDIENVPESVLPYVQEQDRPKLLAMFQEIEAGEPVVRGDFWMQWKSGMAPRCERVIYSVYKDKQGKPVKALAIGRNITAEKLAEERYQHIIRDLLSANLQALCEFRLNLSKNLCYNGVGTSTYIQRFISAETVDQLFANIMLIITNDEDKRRFQAVFNREGLLTSFRNNRSQRNLTYRRRGEDTRTGWVTTYITMVENPNTADIEAIAYSVDSSREKEEELILDAITKKEYDYIAVIDVASLRMSFYMTTEKSGDTMTVQCATYDESLRESIKLLAAPEDAERCRQGLSFSRILSELTKNDEYVFSYFAYSQTGKQYRKQDLFRYLDEDKGKVLLTRTDITAAFKEELLHVEQINQALQTAENANQMKTDFLSNVSHDMRTPLNAVLGYANLGKQARDEASMRNYLEKIEQAGGTLLALINDTLDLQKIETGAIQLKPHPISCSDIINGILTAVRPLIEEKNIAFTVDNSRAVMAMIDVDAVRVQEIFINLLSNAIKFTPAGGKVDFIVECVKLEPDCVHDRLIIRDTGIGMTPEFLPKVFEPFSQERTAATAHIGGSGLGLSIVRRLVDLMGGTISVTSDLGKGTEFTVCLDFKRVDDMVTAAKPKKNVSLEKLAGKRVLLCEDNSMNTEIAKSLLEMKNMDVTCAGNGQVGLDLFCQSPAHTFDVILMDIRMPVMNGYEATAEIRHSQQADAKTIPIIAMSADAYEDDVKKAIDAGMNAHIAKPIDPQRMFEEIAKCVASG